MDEEKEDDINNILGEIESKKPDQPQGSLDKIAEVLNTTFEQDLDVTNKQLKLIEAKKLIVSKKEEAGLIVFDDQEEIKNGLRSIISNMEQVMQKLQDDIKIGSRSFNHKVYSECARVLVESYKELSEINKNIFDCRLKAQAMKDKPNKGSGAKTSDDSLTLTHEQVISMIDKARNTSSINAIDATFKIVE